MFVQAGFGPDRAPCANFAVETSASSMTISVQELPSPRAAKGHARKPQEAGKRCSSASERVGFKAFGTTLRALEALANGVDSDSIDAMQDPGQLRTVTQVACRLANLPFTSDSGLISAAKGIPRNVLYWATCIIAAHSDPGLQFERQRVAHFITTTGASRATYYRILSKLLAAM